MTESSWARGVFSKKNDGLLHSLAVLWIVLSEKEIPDAKTNSQINSDQLKLPQKLAPCPRSQV